MLDWIFRKNTKKAIVKRAIRHARSLLDKSHAPDLDLKVDNILWYGAVEIDPKYCVVWVILRGKDSEVVPPLLLVRDQKSLDRVGEKLSIKACEWLKDLAGIVEGEFRSAGWEWQIPKIGIESAERVKRGGGFSYFR